MPPSTRRPVTINANQPPYGSQHNVAPLRQTAQRPEGKPARSASIAGYRQHVISGGVSRIAKHVKHNINPRHAGNG
jgi:hypothetical protein